MVALGINLACHPLNAQKMSHGPGLKLLMAKAVKTSDALVLKMIRNISQHQDQSLKRQFLASYASSPTDTPTHPTDTPTHPTDTPTHPTDTPTHPTDTPTHPTDTPTHPTDTPTQLYRHYFTQDYIPLLGTIIQQSTDDQMQLEALGILGNLVIADLNYLKIVEEFNLMQFISQKLKVSFYPLTLASHAQLTTPF